MESDLYKDYDNILKAEQEADKKILDIVKQKVSIEIFKDIEYILEESGNTFNFKITDKPLGEYQEEDEEYVKGIYVNQTTNGGYSGDEFAGTVSVPLSESEFFQFNYSM